MTHYQVLKMTQQSSLFYVANFTQEEIGDPILDTELAAGDVLYFPRGTIHQVCNVH